jgi:DNA polymerase-1
VPVVSMTVLGGVHPTTTGAAAGRVGEHVAMADGTAGVHPPHAVTALVRAAGFSPGDPMALALLPDARGAAVVTAGGRWTVAEDPARAVTLVGAELAPRWVWWSAADTAAPLVAGGVRFGACWDLAAVHGLLHGGATDDPARVWAAARNLPADDIPRPGQLDLFGGAPGSVPDGDPEEPVRPDGYLRPEWADGSALAVTAARSPAVVLRRAARWAELALTVQRGQEAAVRRLPDRRRAPTPPPLPLLTAWSESAAALLAVELGCDGLPVDRTTVEQILTASVGPRPADAAAAERFRRERDGEVLRHLPRTLPGGSVPDLRNPASVRALLAAIGIDVPDTRSWRLERLRGTHPALDALLAWRKAERLATTYGYGWLDRHVAADGRLRGAWTGSDGGAGRMTASAGLHNLPAELRPAVLAAPGHVFVRADLGQVEPRVLAAVSGDEGLAAATTADDLYSPVAAALRCDRPTAKVAVLAAMYGQTSGPAGQALRDMERAYPVAMRFLRDADEQGRAGSDVRTYGGRLVRVGPLPLPDAGAADPERAVRAAVAARGRYARNAVVQGAAAELFKMWALTVRAALTDDLVQEGRVVLCLHDELLVHVRVEHADETVRRVHAALDDAAGRWAAGRPVRFVADVSVVRRWSDAK